MSFLNNNTFLMTEKVLDFLWQKQSVSSTNLANVETPGYKAKYVTFEDELRNRINSSTNKNSKDIRNSLEQLKATVNYTNNESTRADGNNVNADAESVEVAKTALQYNFMIKSFSDDITKFRTIIKG